MIIGSFDWEVLEHSKLGWTFLMKEKERERLGDRLITLKLKGDCC